MKYTHLAVRLFAPLIDLAVDLVNLFIWRDKRVVLVGSWMGDKFMDNPRFFYQYLFAHKDEYAIKKVIWVTRNENVFQMLREEGYEVYMMHSRKSVYYHFKAGVHITCNINYPVKGYAGDLMGQLSGHAKKINMWHGIPLKAGKSTGKNNTNRGLSGKLRYTLRNSKLFCAIFTPGHWDRAYMLSAGETCTKRISEFCGVDPKRFIPSGYPRHCLAEQFLPTEQQVVERMQASRKSILFVPTFREQGEVPQPLCDPAFRSFLAEQDYLWIEKPHPASPKLADVDGLGDQVLILESHFDINVILPFVDILITDYSSAIYDAMAFDKSVLYYLPDYENYANNERGFLCDYQALVGNFGARNTSELMEKIQRVDEDSAFAEALAENTKTNKQIILPSRQDNMKDLLETIHGQLGLFERNGD